MPAGRFPILFQGNCGIEEQIEAGSPHVFQLMKTFWQRVSDEDLSPSFRVPIQFPILCGKTD
ncbi:hypothetical protein OUZ56_005991 [Daphnia magna]|uniref:Uncharacterized protein n=1 Tax=Daphnia magna TaxID=35525 RepID=A0ABQ9YUC6_9CRUS|nr:hypothetical protein OUZ56_005991 [Daphnia magna]